MTTPTRGFATVEFKERLQRMQSGMQEQQLDMVLLTSEADVRYFSGFLTQFWQSPTRPWFLVLPQAGDPVAVIPSIGEYAMQQTWISDIRTWASPHPNDDGVSLLADTVKSIGGGSGRIGLPMGPETHLRMPLDDFERLIEKLETFEWIDATQLVQRTRMIKSPAEVDKMRHVCGLASDCFEDVPSWLQAGMSEIEIFRQYKVKALQAGVDDVSYLVGGAGADGYEDIISPPSERKLSNGDILILDTGCVWDGYFCDFDRNFSMGPASSTVSSAYQRAWDATEAGLAAAKPGLTFSDLFHSMNDLLCDDDTSDSSNIGRLGHGLGTQLTEPASITPFDHTEIQVGMVITLEPGLSYSNNKMMVHEENIVITDDGAQLLSRRASQQIIEIN